MVEDSSYADRQARHDREYEEAWENAPQTFKDAAKAQGMDVEPEDRDSMVIPFDTEYEKGGTPYDPDYHSGAYTPDMAASLDTHLDWVIEKHGIEHAAFIRAIFADLRKPMDDEIIRNRSVMLGRLAGWLICDNKGNILAKAHSLLHSMPRFAASSGYPSMRSSAKECKVSAEWLRRTRDYVCALLGVDVPAEGRKSVEACLKYSLNGKTNHWRKQKFVATKI